MRRVAQAVGLTLGQPFSSEAMGRKHEQSRGAAGRALRSWARDEIRNHRSGVASQSKEIHMGVLAGWE